MFAPPGGPRIRGGGRRRGSAVAPPERPATLRESLPAEVAALVDDAGLTPRLSIGTDLDATGQLRATWLIADPSRLLVVSPNGGEPEIELELDLRGARAIRLDKLVGAQAITAEVDGDDVELVRGTHAEATRFGKVRRQLDDWRQGGEESLAEEEAEDVCPRCGRKLPKDSKVCSHCFDRRQSLLRLMKYLRPHLVKVAMVTVLVLGSRFLSLLQPQLNGLFFDRVLTPDSASGRVAGDWVRWMFSADTRGGLLVQIVGAMLIFQLSSVILQVFQGRLAAWLGYWVVHDIRTELYSHLQALTVRYFDKRQTGAVMSRITQDTRAMQGFLVDGSQHLMENILTFLVVGFILLSTNWKLTLLTIVPAPLVLFFATAFWKKLRLYYGRLWQRWELLTATLQDSLSGVRVVKAFAGESSEIRRFATSSGGVAEAGARANQLRATIFPWLTFSIQLATLAVWFYGGKQVLREEMSPGEIMQFLSYLFMFYGPMQWISQLFNWFNETLAAAERVWEVLDEKPDVAEPVDPAPLAPVRGGFVFENVTFGYESHEPVLKNVDLEVQPGEMIGLVGHSGAGKSTMINLICRFYDVDEGRILLDGRDIRDIPSQEYRRNIGVVLQDNFLFNGTVAANIAYGRPTAPLTDVMAAAKAANAHGFICRFPDGYDTMVGERGYRLSGGERQRISIARAILHNPRILILDEATASVDTETEREIQEALNRLIEGRTTFAIAHRLSTLRHADRLVVIDHGKVVEVGTHDELLSKPEGTFKKLVTMQTELNRIQYIGG